MPRLRVLLVDDQQLILLALERMLRRMRSTWEVVVALSGKEALARMEAQPFDVLVTDLYMPGFDGTELLAWTRAHHPGTARVVLSGHQDPVMIHAATRHAHRFLSKPCEPEQLLDVVVQVAEVCALPLDGLREAVAGTVQLPGSPVTCHRVKAFLNDPAAAPTVFQDLVLVDPGLAARVLQFVNSGFFGQARPLAVAREALKFLDREELGDLACEPAPLEVEAVLKPIRERHARLARGARAIAAAEGGSAAVQDLAQSAGLLTAAGPLILASALPGRSTDGLDLPALSRHFLNLAGLPAPLLDIVGHHREPGRAADGASLALAAVHVASGGTDEGHLAGAGFPQRLPAWRQLLSREGA